MNNQKCSVRILRALAGISIFAAPALATPHYDKMVVFGDSLSDDGNFSAFVGPGVLSSLNYDANRFTDGPATTPSTAISGVAVEQLNQRLGLSPLSPWVFGGNDYAVARATTSAQPPDFSLGQFPGTGVQVGAYLQNYSVSADSLFVIWAGANDLFNGTTAAEIQAAETSAISNLNLQIATLLQAGAKNILWFDLPDLSLTPDGVLEGPALNAQLHASSLQFRTDWQASLDVFRALNPSASIVGVDTYSLIHSIVANPAAYGLTNVTDPALGQANVNPDDYLFWDLLHPTTKADSAVADFAFNALTLQPVPEPSTYGIAGSLFLLAIGFARRRGILRRSKTALT